jgi:type I restriction-modification system DNA methylase subunit
MNTEEQQFLNDLDKRLWNAADRLRSNVNPSDYMHVVLGLVFLKYVFDAFKERRTELEAAFKNPEHDYYLGSDSGDMLEQELEARDYYLEKNVFWVPALARWDFIKDSAKVANGTKLQVKNGKIFEYEFRGIGRLLDDALEAIEKDNPKLKGVLDKSYARWRVDDALPGLIDEFSKIQPLNGSSLNAKDILGHVYEYFLGEFSIAAGKRGGEFYTPKGIVSLIVEMLGPYQGRVYNGWQDRKGKTLFIDARNLGYMKDRVLRDFKPEDVARVAHTFHAWKRGQAVDEPGYAKAATLSDIRQHDHVLTPGRYVGAAAQEEGEAFEDKMARLTATLSDQFTESARLEAAIRKNLAGLGYPLKTSV